MDWILRKFGVVRDSKRRIGLEKKNDEDKDESSISIEPVSSSISPTSESESETECEPLTVFYEDHQYALEALTRKKTWITVKNLRFHANGVFSNVYRGTMTQPEEREIVMKKSFPPSNLRNPEMILLAAMRLSDPHNIMPLLYTYKKSHEAQICEVIILPYMPQSLDQLIGKLDMVDIKLYTWQLFNGLSFLENNNIAHRDIKPVNILVDHDKGKLLIGDFGNAKVIDEGNASTPYQVTRFYRAPELLYGVREYNWMVDVWSGGCVVGEMLKGRILFPGANTEHQLSLIHESFGPPSDVDFIDMGVVEVTEEMKKSKAKKSRHLKKHMPTAPKALLAFVREVLQYAPLQRIYGESVLSHSIFEELFEKDRVRFNGQLTASLLIRQSGAATRFYNYKKVIASNRGKQSPSIPTPARTPEKTSFSVM
ncbi:hypothetical protein PFISCL1PPCAC_5962 [Pristionchus fissidentatus]|uniref:Protein kinase domain-containing protein n=1 Tax=Pristionchus fissidentatus TaxID=1538716 RepID=A0AAV5V817_9BILA|nr:hypothetical protein PFISCL1PPCAC_5962 [Pristionchus fissidentatus]